ncbi:unnamed protein product [Rhizopus stolonifer]
MIIFASCTKADGSKWTVKMKNSNIDSHNHPIAIDKTTYHAYRKMNDDQQVTIAQMLKSHIKPSQVVRFVKESDENSVTKELKSMLVTKKHSIEKARRFSEVVVIDTTYKMNLNQTPVINIVGVDNFSSEYGSSSLKTFFTATVIVSDEETITFDWILQILRNEIWNEENMPGVFVTDDDKALGRSLPICLVLNIFALFLI